MTDYDTQPDRTPPPQPELSRAQIEADEVDLHVGLSESPALWPTPGR